MAPPPLPPQGRAPLFVERQTYRMRRLRDAARALPVLAVLVWLVPLLWQGTGSPVPASHALTYLFGSWLVLGATAGLLLAALRRAEARVAAAEDAEREARSAGGKAGRASGAHAP